jgi:hypothetical protein
MECAVGEVATCDKTNGDPETCVGGYYVDDDGVTKTCEPCPAGNSCNGDDEPDPCPEGTYSVGGDDTCDSCGEGVATCARQIQKTQQLSRATQVII